MPEHFPEVRHGVVAADARELDGVTLLHSLGSTPDLVMGGPPCDDYTQTGKRRGVEGDKGPLIFRFLRLVEDLQPKCFVFENVPNLVRQFRSIFDLFLNESTKIGYSHKWALLKACDYGAPTGRTRVFVVGWQQPASNQAFRFPDPTHADPTSCDLLVQPGGPFEPFRLVRDVLDGLPDVRTPAGELFSNHMGRVHRAKTIEHLKTVPLGKQVRKSFRYRVPWNGLAQSLTAGQDDNAKSFLHPHFDREMSVREYARLHLFPDSWFFSGTHHNGIKQVANSVPIPMGQAVLSAVIECQLTAH